MMRLHYYKRGPSASDLTCLAIVHQVVFEKMAAVTWNKIACELCEVATLMTRLPETTRRAPSFANSTAVARPMPVECTRDQSNWLAQ